MESSAPNSIPYAPPNIVRVRRARIRRAVIVLALVVSCWALYEQRSEIRLRTLRLYWGWQCMRHVIPPDTVLIETDPTKAAALLATNRDYCTPDTEVGPERMTRAMQCGTRLAWGTVAVYVPRAWREYAKVEINSNNFQPPMFASGPIVFLGGRRTPDGRDRLVIVGGPASNALRLPADIPTLVLTPATLLEKLPPNGAVRMGYARSSRHVGARLRPGQADPADATHLTVEVDVMSRSADGRVLRSGTLDGYLGNDDKITWTLRDPATTQGL